MVLAIAQATRRQLAPRIGCKERRQQRDAEQRDKQQCECAAGIQTSKYDTEQLFPNPGDGCKFRRRFVTADPDKSREALERPLRKIRLSVAETSFCRFIGCVPVQFCGLRSVCLVCDSDARSGIACRARLDDAGSENR